MNVGLSREKNSLDFDQRKNLKFPRKFSTRITHLQTEKKNEEVVTDSDLIWCERPFYRQSQWRQVVAITPSATCQESSQSKKLNINWKFFRKLNGSLNCHEWFLNAKKRMLLIRCKNSLTLNFFKGILLILNIAIFWKLRGPSETATGPEVSHVCPEYAHYEI